MGQSPQLYPDYVNFANYQPIGGVGWLGPMNTVARIAFASATSGSVLQIPFSAPNSTYNLSFYGPGINCGTNDTIKQIFIESYENATLGIYGGLLYFSWVPGDPTYGSLDISKNLFNEAASSFSSLDQQGDAAATIYLVRNSFFNKNDLYLLECRLQNVSYNVRFNSSYPSQSIEVLSAEHQNFVSLNGKGSPEFLGLYPDGLGSKILTYCAIMDAFGEILVGSVDYDRYGFNTTHYTSYNLTKVDWTSESSAGQALEQLFQNITWSLLSDSHLT